MPRGPYDTTCDLIYGPSGASPGTVYATTNCRVVPLFTEKPLLYPLSLRTAYITMDLLPNQAQVVGTLPNPALDWDFADRLAVPTGSAANYMALWSESMLWRAQALYYRTLVMPLAPGPTPPGPTCLLAKLMASGMSYSSVLAGGTTAWFYLPIVAGPWHVNVSIVPGHLFLTGWRGTSCGVAVPVFTDTLFPGHSSGSYPDVGTGVENGYLQIHNPDPTPVSYGVMLSQP